jgi:ABC-2 type transport system permease protein
MALSQRGGQIMNFLAVMGGALAYEFRMQVRRPSLWLVLILVNFLDFGLWFLFTSNSTTPAHDAVLYLVQFMAWFMPLCAGLVLADRLARDKKTHFDELLDTFPGSLGGRLAGKYLGSTLATLVPIVLLYAVGIAYSMLRWHAIGILFLAVGAFAAIMLPAVFFAAGASIALPTILNVPIYQILFVGYWFWANLLPPRFRVPSLISTMLNATGPWAFAAFFHFQWVFLKLHLTVLQGIESVTLLTAIGIGAIAGVWGYLRWKQAHR